MRITGQLLRSRTKKPLHIAQYIDLSSTNIVTLDHLEICPKLRTLVARNNRLESVPNLDCCSQLWKVDIAHNKLKCLNGFSRFSVLGCLVLSNNCLDWGDVEKLCHVHILELSLHGNPKLEKDPYYRTHVIDSLPLLWMLDGRLVTFAERFQVSKFFKESELTERPVRHKIPKKRFTPTSLKNLPVTGVFGEKTEHWMKRFPLNEKMSKELDQRRLHYLAYNLKEDVRLQATYVDAMRSSVSEDLFLEIVVQREKDKEKSNMLLLLLVAFLEFRIPNDVIEQALDIAKLNKIGSYETRHIFLLSRVNQCRVASLLLAGIKIDRDAKLEDGLYDTLYLCLCNLVAERHKLSNGDCVTRKPGSRDILAAEVVQLFCIVPAFLMLVSRDPGLIDLVSSATRDPDITEQLCDILWKGKVKKGNPEDIFQVLGSYILKKIHKRYPQPGKSGKNTPISPERKDLPLRLSNYTKTLEGKGVLPKRAQSAVYVTHHSCDAGFTREARIIYEFSKDKPSEDILKKAKWNTLFYSNDTGNKSSKTSSSSGRKSAQSRQSTTKRVELGDKVYTEDQVYGHIVALPDKNIALVRQHVIPARGYLQNRIHASLNNRFVYVDTQMLQWQHHQGFWNLKEKEKDNDMKLPHKRHEENSENFMTETIKKELPIEVWMSFTTEDSSAKPSLDSESCGTVITKHVRELVRECIKEAKTRNHERNDESAVDSKPIEQHNVQFDERESTKNAEDFEEIHDKEEESFHETENDIEWERDDDMISQTENYRLEAWKFFHLANLEERAIAEQKVSSVQQSRPSRVGSCCITSRHGRHGSVSASKDVYTSSGKRLSFPLPGWIEELHAISQQRSYSKSADLPRKSYDSEIKESWAPIISPAPVARSGCRSTHVKSGNNTYGNNIEYCPKHRPKCQQRPS